MALPLRSERILVADDEPTVRVMLQQLLVKLGHAVLLAKDGREALALFEAERPDMLVLDVMMPGLDGFEVCRALRASPAGQHVPVLMLTALTDTEHFERAIECGADDFLTKPVRRGELAVRIRALTRLRQAEEELRAKYELVRTQSRALIEAGRQKEELTAFLLHDLKNPLTAILANVQIAERSRGLPTVARESLADAVGSIHSLRRMMLNLLDISRSEDGALVPKLASAELGELAASVVESMLRQADIHQREVRAVPPPTPLHAHIDAELIRRVIENLVENAFKYAPSGTPVRVEVARHDDHHLALRVLDEGPGIPAELRLRIFEKYARIDNEVSSQTMGSRGLGLAFCQRVAEVHGGRIWVEPNVPHGSVFTILVPAA